MLKTKEGNKYLFSSQVNFAFQSTSPIKNLLNSITQISQSQKLLKKNSKIQLVAQFQMEKIKLTLKELIKPHPPKWSYIIKITYFT